MKLILVTCPHCGGRLQTPEATDHVKCEYCGTLSRLQRRTRILERVLPPPPAAPDRPVPIAVQQRSRGQALGLVIIALCSMAPLVLIGGSIIQRARHDSSSSPAGDPAAGAAGAAPGEPPSWQGGSVMVADLDGDGASELIGRTRRIRERDEIRVVALDLETGKPRWESEPLGDYSNTYQGLLALAGDLVLFASPRAEIRAFGAADGKRRWTTTLDERLVRFCDRGETIVAVGTDDVERPLLRATGARAAATAEAVPPADPPKRGPKPKRAAPAPACEAAPSDKPAARDRHLEWAIANKLDLSGDRIVSGPGGRVASGTRKKGTRVATLIALDAANKARWRAELPMDPLAASERAPSHVVVGDTVVCGSYGLEGSGWRSSVTCFALADGRRLWDRALGDRGLSSLGIAGRTLLISSSNQLEARDLDTGATRWTFGT